MSRLTRTVAAACFLSLLTACAPGAGSSVVTPDEAPVQAQGADGPVVVALSSQEARSWTVQEVNDSVDTALDGSVSPWQPSLVTPFLPEFETNSVRVVVFTLGQTGEEVDEYFAMKGYAVRVDLTNGASEVAQWGAPTNAEGAAFVRVVQHGFDLDPERQAQGNQALLDLMSGARSESELAHAFGANAEWFDAYPQYRAHLDTRAPGAVSWLEGARGGELAR